MKRYHMIVKIERVRKELQLGNETEALRVAKTIPEEWIKNMSDFGVIAEAYFQNKDYETAKQYFWMIYKKTGSRRVLWQLIHTTIRLKQTEEAEKYLKKFIELAPEDVYQYIFRYQLDRLEGKSIKERIETLEKLKKVEYMEHWVYELAKLYHKAGEVDKCVKECENLILWFGQGEYVERAKALCAYYNGELDVTLAGQDSKRFVAEMKRVLNSSQRETILKKVEETAKKTRQGELSQNTSRFQVDPEKEKMEKLEQDIEEAEEKQEVQKVPKEQEKEDREPKQDNDPRMELRRRANSAIRQQRQQNKMPDPTIPEKKKQDVKELNTFGLLMGKERKKKSEGYEKVPTYREMLAKKENQKEQEAKEIEETKDRQTKAQKTEEKDSLESLPENSIVTEEPIHNIQETEQNLKKEDAAEAKEQTQDRKRAKGKREISKSEFIQKIRKKAKESEPIDKSVLEEETKPFTPVKKKALSEQKTKPLAQKRIENEEKEEEKEEEVPVLEELPVDGLLYQSLQQRQENLEDLFGSFAYMSSIRSLLISNLERILQQQKARIIIRKEDPSIYGQMELAKKLARTLHRLGMVSSSNTALIRGEKLNQISLKKMGQQLKNCCLIVDHVGALKPEKAAELLWFCRQFGTSVGVILVDSKDGITRLFRMKKEFESVFFSKFYLRKYSANDWMALVYGLIKEADYEIEESVYRLFLERIKQFMKQQKSDLLWETIHSYTSLVMEQTEIRNSKLLLDMSIHDQFEAAKLMIISPEDMKSADKLLSDTEKF